MDLIAAGLLSGFVANDSIEACEFSDAGVRDMMSNVDRPLLRQAEPRDAATILEFVRELAEYERLSHEVVADEASLARGLFGEHPAAEVVIAELDEEPAGFALFFTTFSTFLARPGLYLEDLYVKPAFRGRGIGEALLRHLAGVAVARDYGRFEWAVLDWNERAIAFYERMGACPMSDWTVYRLSGERLGDTARKAGVAPADDS